MGFSGGLLWLTRSEKGATGMGFDVGYWDYIGLYRGYVRIIEKWKLLFRV